MLINTQSKNFPIINDFIEAAIDWLLNQTATITWDPAGAALWRHMSSPK